VTFATATATDDAAGGKLSKGRRRSVYVNADDSSETDPSRTSYSIPYAADSDLQPHTAQVQNSSRFISLT